MLVVTEALSFIYAATLGETAIVSCRQLIYWVISTLQAQAEALLHT
jgi:hypothetical protein